MTIADSGQGFEANNLNLHNELGLVELKERAHGGFFIGSKIDEITKIKVRITPLGVKTSKKIKSNIDREFHG